MLCLLYEHTAQPSIEFDRIFTYDFMPFPVSDLIQRFLETADARDMLTLLDGMARIAQENAPTHLRAGLAADLGFDPLDAGPLKQARLLEPFAMLWISLALQYGYGREIAFQFMRRAT